METVYFGNTENVRECNVTVGVRFDGNDKMYHYGAYLDEEVVDALNNVNELVTNLYVSGKGRKNGSVVKLVELDYTRVSKSASRAIDYIDEIKLIAGVLHCNGKRIDTCETVKVRQVDNPDGKTFGSVVEKNKTKKTEKDSDNMFNKTFKDAGKQVKGKFGISMFDQKEAIKLGNSWFVLSEDSKSLTDVSDFVMEMDFMPGIVMPKLSSTVKKGDILYNNGELRVVTAKMTGGSIKSIDENGNIKEVTPVSNALMGGVSYVTVLMNPMSNMGQMMMGGQPTGDAVANSMAGMMGTPMMMMAMMGKGSDSDSSDMVGKMMMMQMMGGMAPQVATPETGGEG